MTVGLVVPCYEEEDALGAFGTLLPALAVDEILFVDDGSTDSTAARLGELAAADPRVRILTHAANRGVGAAMRTGLAAARADVVVVYDADRTYPPADVARLVAAVEAGADVATASPFAAGGSAPEVPWRRLVLSRGAALAYRHVIGPRALRVATFTCAFRAYRRAWIPRLAFASDGFGAAGELLGLALLGGARVAEVPSRLGVRTEGASKLRVLPSLAQHLGVLVRLARRRARRDRRRVTPG
jgi:dolichol-phosphate mannosyltransferase